MKIYTNRYHDFTPSQGIPVRITYGSPRWRLSYTIAASAKTVTPGRWFMEGTDEEFTERYRLTKLVTMIALRRSTFQLCATPKTQILVDACDGLATVEYTRYPEAKGLRGLMKLDRRDRKNGQYQLQYKSDWHDEIGLRNILGQFLAKENRRK